MDCSLYMFYYIGTSKAVHESFAKLNLGHLQLATIHPIPKTIDKIRNDSKCSEVVVGTRARPTTSVLLVPGLTPQR